MLFLILRELSSLAALACGNEGKSGKEDASGFNAGVAVEPSIDSVEDAQLMAIEEDVSEEFLKFRVWL